MATVFLERLADLSSDPSPLAELRIHLIGAAGAGMQALAAVLGQLGSTLSGSDLVADNCFETLPRWHSGHSAQHIDSDCQLVVHSAAIDENNVELQEARRLGIATMDYPTMLGQLMAGQFGVAVAGTHGKSTTTAMTAEILLAAGLSPTVLCGAAPLGKTSGSRAGDSQLLLAEACEYRNHFHALRPQVAAVLGIELDHFDFFSSPSQLETSFAQFLNQVDACGVAIRNADCPTTMRAAEVARCRVETFGVSSSADWYARSITHMRGIYRFELWYRGTPLGLIRLAVPGLHNVQNALAAAALAYHSGADAEAIGRGLASFSGLQRRLETVGDGPAGTILDDYAHHPTEIAATLATIRQQIGSRRLWCVFQPHQVSRTTSLLDTLAASLQNADKILVTEIFRAREPQRPEGEVTAADLATQVRQLGGDVPPVHSPAQVLALLQSQWQVGDVLVTMGAGDIGKIAHEFDQWIRKNRSLR